MWTPTCVALLTAVMVTTASASAEAQGPARAAKLPAAIEAAFTAAYPKATIKGFSKEKYAGKDAIEVESVDNGKTRDLTYLLDGTVAVLEEEVSAADIPEAVAAAIKADFSKAMVTRYERAVEKGVTSYEVRLKGAKVAEAEYTAAGKRK